MLPEYVNVGGMMVRVVEADGLEEFGKADYGKAEVYVNVNTDPQVQVSTMFHELAHIAHTVYGCQDEMNEEAVVNFTERFVYNLLRDNDLSGVLEAA